MFPEPKYFAALTTLAVAAVVAQQPAAYAAYSTVGTAHYDAARKAVIVPYSGAFPTFVTDSLGGPPRVYFDFEAAANLRGLHESAVYGHPSLTRWAMAPKPGGKVRLVLTFRAGTKVLLLNDASHHQMILIPQGVQMGAMPMTSMVAAPVTVPWKAGQPHTFKQTFGTTDFDYTVGPRAKGAKRDSVNVNVKSNGVTDFHVQSDPAHDFVSFSISIKGKPGPTPPPMAGRATPRPTPRATVRPTARPQITPSPVPLATPQPLPTPEPLPTPSLTPTPAPSPIPTPLPSPSASPATTSQGPNFLVSAHGGYPYSITETFTGQNGASFFDTANQAASVEGGDLEARFLDNWTVLLNGDYAHLQISDSQTNSSTAHDRDEIQGNLGLGYRFTPGGTEEMFGLGVFGRYISTSNVSLPNDTAISAPAKESTLTAANQLYIGPSLFTRLDFPFGPVGLEVKAGTSPYLLGMLSPTAEELSGTLLAYWAIPSVYLRLGLLQLSVGYDYESILNLSGSTYSYTRNGPVGRLDLRF